MPDKIDELLDSALGTYAKPRIGLERRILAHVQEVRFSQAMPWRRWLGWGFAATLAASLLLYVGVTGSRQQPINGGHTAPVQEQASAPRVPDTRPEAPRSLPGSQLRQAPVPIRHRSTRGETAAAAVPKLDVFPAPQPLSAQERALVELAAQPAEVRQQALARPADNAPLQVSAIQIPLIPPPDEGENQGDKP